MQNPIARMRGILSSCVALLLAACGGGGGGGGNTPPPPPPADTTAPQTTITAAPPALTSSAGANLTFSANETSTFESRLDGAAFATATSPQALASLADGSHTFEVRARDAAGNLDATPATHTWVVDTVPPDTQFTTTPALLATTQPHPFGATSTEPNSTFEMSVDNAVYTTVSFPLNLSGLPNGGHLVRVRARDAAGNVDPTPAQFDWTVSLSPPDTTITAQPAAFTNSLAATFSFTSTLAGSTFEYRVDAGAWIPTNASPVQLTALSEGQHTFEVRARFVTLIDATPAIHSWRVDTTPPTAAMLFPTTISYTDAATLTVRGTANDAAGLQGVAVNGVAASSATSFNTWSAVIPVPTGDNTIRAIATDLAGNTSSSASLGTVTNRGPPLLQSGGTDYDATSDSLIVADVETNSVLGFRLSDGAGRMISRVSQAADPEHSVISDLVVDAPNNRAIAVDWSADAVVSIDLSTGARSPLSLSSGNSATSLTIGNGIAYDAANQRAYVTVTQTPSFTHAIIAVDIQTGNRSVLSSNTVGSGPAFTNAGAIVFDAANARLLVAATTGGNTAILQVSLVNGDRVLYSQSPGTGTGPAIPFPSGLHLDAANGFLYVSDASINPALFRVEIASGNRTQIGGAGSGSGAALSLLGGGLALKPSTGQLFVPLRNGEVQALDTTSLARSVVVNPRVGGGVDMDRPFTVLAEQTSGPITSLLFAEPEGQRLMRLDLSNSGVSVVAGGGVGAGPALSRFIDVLIDPRTPPNARTALGLLSSPGNALVSIDLATGNRTLLANLSPATQLRNIALDANGNRVLFTNIDFSGSTHGLYAVDLTTFNTTTISSSTVGSGANFNGPSRILLDPEQNPTRALLVDLNPSAFLQVNLASGDRSPFIGVSGTPPITLIGPLHYDRPNNQIFGLNLYPQNLFVSRLTAGGGETSRALLSGMSVGNGAVRGTGPLVDFGAGLTIDSARGVAYAGESTLGAIMAIDLVSGDRVIIAR